jgi:hypothetical protein
MKNTYTLLLGKLYDKCPKEVLAALLVRRIKDNDNVKAIILREWEELYLDGVLTEPVPDAAKSLG